MIPSPRILTLAHPAKIKLDIKGLLSALRSANCAPETQQKYLFQKTWTSAMNFSPTSNGTDPRNSQGSSKTRIYLIDDHLFFAAALSSLINNERDLYVCGSGFEPQKIVSEIVSVRPEIILADVHLSSRNNWLLPIELRKHAGSIPILFVSSLQNPKAETQMKWLEPCSFVEKTKDPADIIKAIRETVAKMRFLQRSHQPPGIASQT